MNEFNNSVKQRKWSIAAVVITAFVAIMLCSAISITTLANKASATPSEASLQETLDATSCAYFDALQLQSEAQEKVNEANERIEYCDNKIPEVQEKIGVRAKSMYMNGTVGILDIFLGASSIEDLVNNMQALSIVSINDKAMLDECKALKAESEEQKITLDENLAAANEQAAIAAEAYNEAQEALAAAQAAAAAAAAAAAQQQQDVPDTPGGGGGGGGYIDPTTGNAIADRALGEQGKPYVWGGVGPDGYDCSGLVSYAVSGAHTRIGTTSTFMGWPRLSSPEVGCVCTDWGHCGIYVGGGSMCHAPTFGQTVCCSGVQGGMIYVTP